MTVYLAVGLHVFQCGVLWRYAKLFIPVDLRHVKHEVRDLCKYPFLFIRDFLDQQLKTN